MYVTVIREKSRSSEDKNQLLNSSSENSSSKTSTLGWLQDLQSVQQCSETVPNRASVPDHAVSSFMRNSAVPPPPTNIDNLNLSQVFRTPSSQPATDSAHLDFRNNAERSESSDFMSLCKESKSADLGHLKSAGFKVPYRSSKPVAKVSRQEAVTVVASSGQSSDSRQRETAYDLKYQADTASGLSDVDFSTGNSRQKVSPQNPTLPEGKSGTIAKTPYLQPGFSGVREPAVVPTSYQEDGVINSSVRHVGDTPLALSGI